MRPLVRAALVALGAYFLMSALHRPQVLAVGLALGSAALSALPTARRATRYVTGLVRSVVFDCGMSIVVLVTRLGRRPRFVTGWRAATSSSAVSRVAFRRSDLSPQRASTTAFALKSLLLLLVLDTASGSLWPLQPAIRGEERLESTPGVKPGDVEYQVQRDGEHLYLDVSENGEWTQPAFSSPTTNWDPSTGRYTPASREGGRLRVAVVGGSAAFGLGQSDADTVANKLAEGMAAAGVDAEVRNLGGIAWTTHQVAEDLRRRYERGERYDVVVSYSGFNDLVLGMNGRRVPENLFSGSLKPDRGILAFWADHSALARVFGREPVRPKPIVWRVLSASFDGSWRSSTSKQDEGLFNLREGYVELRDVTDSHGVTLLWIQQPNWFEASVTSSQLGYGGISGLEKDVIGDKWKHTTDLFLSDVHGRAVDARAALDGEPCWIDFSHTRGICSEKIARVALPALLDAVGGS